MLLSCGDALVDFLPVTTMDGRDAAVPVAGGSCLNIAVGMARKPGSSSTRRMPLATGMAMAELEVPKSMAQ